jgi:hypothetical protein
MPVHSVDAYPEKACRVGTYQKSKTVWIASGDFQGEPLQQQGRSEQSALAKWKDIAEWRYRSS